MFSFFKIILILYTLIKIIKAQSVCQYNDCFNCSVCGTTPQSCNCQWSVLTNACQRQSQSKDKVYYNYDYFNKCYDEISLKIQYKYCGDSNIKIDDNASTFINLIENDGKYGAQNLYCEYVYSQMSDPSSTNYNILSTVSQSTIQQIKLYINIVFYNGTNEQYKITEEFKKTYNNIKTIKIQVYCEKKLSVSPFSIEISKNQKQNNKLLISVGIILLFCIICGVIIFFVSRKAAQNARRRQEIFLQIARANRRQRYGDDRTSNSENYDPSSASESEASVQDKNKKLIEKLLNTTLAPMKYNPYLGIRDGNPTLVCTICLEEFKVDKSIVSVTPCQHVFHFQCISNWLTNNVVNPKCPNCNYNLIQEKNECICSQGLYDIPEIECNVMRSNQRRMVNIERRIPINENHNIGSVALDTVENRLITRNDNFRGRNRNSIVTSASINNLCTSRDDDSNNNNNTNNNNTNNTNNSNNNNNSNNTSNKNTNEQNNIENKDNNKDAGEEVIVIEDIDNNEN